MKYIFYILLIFISGCSHSLFNSKEYDVRNAIIEKPLVIPNNVYNFKYYNNSSSSARDHKNSVVLNLLFNEEFSSNNFTNYKAALNHEDIMFLKFLKAENSYPNIRNEINQESLAIISKNNEFINKVLKWQIDEALMNPSTEYKYLNNN